MSSRSKATVRIAVAEGVGVPDPSQAWPGAVVTSTSASLTGLKPGTTYTFAAYAVNAAGIASAATTARLQGSLTRLTAPATSTAGASIALHGTLTNLEGRGMANQPVQILTRAGATGPWGVYRQVTTDWLGNVIVMSRPRSHTHLMLRYAGRAGTFGALSAPATVRVRTSVSARLVITPAPVAGNSARRGNRVVLTGIVGPNKAGQAVYLQKLVGKTWKNVAVVRLGATSTYGFVLPTATRGATSYRVLRPADAVNSSGVSATQVLTVV